MSEMAALREVAWIEARIVDPREPEYSSLPHVSAEHIVSMTGQLRTIQSAAEDGMESGKYLFEAGDVLYSKLRPYLRKAAVADFRGLCSADMYPIKTDSVRLIPGFLRAILVSDRFTEFANEASARSRMPKVNRKQLFAYQFELPPIERQLRVASELKTQLAIVEEARQAIENQIKEFTSLANAIVRQSLCHLDTKRTVLGDVLQEVKCGVGARWVNYPVLGATRKGLAPAKEPVGKYPERYKQVLPGTVFYNPMRILIGSIAMVDDDDTPGITSPDYVVLRGREAVMDSRWFYYWLRSPEGERSITSLARGAVRERMLFNRLAEGKIDLPPYPVQQTASQALAQIRPLQAHIKEQHREIELLPTRLLVEVFQN
jgi:type I restriction enzyme, S subunit